MMAGRFVASEEPSVAPSSTIGINPPPHTSPSSLPPGSTRVVRLRPSSVLDAPIQVSMLEINLSLRPDYECLSYTWGTDHGNLVTTSAVDVDGKTVRIRTNLFNALCRLRLADRERLLWVDGLSINQTDLEEKAQQVAMIGKIFQQSVRVLAWVGEHSDDSELVFTLSEWIQRVGSQKRLQSSRFSTWKDMIRAWSSFLDRRYFHRVWTFQEVVCHKDVLVCCGPDQQAWQDLMGQRFLPPKAGSFRDLFVPDAVKGDLSQEEEDRWTSNASAIDTLDQARAKFFAINAKELLHYIIDLRHRECSDRRDRVYAVLPLSRDDAVEASVGTDYKISIPDLCYKVMMVTNSNTVGDRTLSALLWGLGCDHNEAGCFIDLLLDRSDSAVMMKSWTWHVEDLVKHDFGFLTEYTEVFPFNYREPDSKRIAHLLSWRTAARERGSWPQTPGKGGYPPFRSRFDRVYE